MHRSFRRITLAVFSLGFILLFSSWHPVLSAPISPRDNPEFWDKLSSIVLIDPATLGYPSSRVPFLLDSLDGLVNLLGDVPVGPNVLTNQDPTTQAQNEPSIAVNPTDPDHVIATSNDYRLRVDPPPEHDVRAGYYVSFDGGNTWPGDGIIDISTIPNTFAAGDPAIAIHDIHNVYYSFIAFNRSTDDGGVAVAKSTDGGLTWLDPVVVDWNSPSEFQDKEYLAVDASGSPYDGNVYLTWTRFGYGTPIYFSRSTDGGSTYVNPFQISDSGLSSNQGSIPAVGPDGTLYVAWFNYDTSAIRLNKSTNGGLSFGTPVHVASVKAIPSPLPGAEFRDNSFPTMDVDPTNGNVYVAWSDYRNGDADIYFTRSTNGGSTWSTPLRLNDDSLSNEHHQFFPWVDVAPNGKIYVGWYDSRLDPAPQAIPLLYDEYVAASTDSGQTFSSNQRVSEVTSDSSIGGFNTPFIGDYSGLAATNDFVYPAWVDTRRSQEDIYTQRLESVSGRKTAPAWVSASEPFTYTISLNSSFSISNNQVTDPVPAGAAYLPGSARATSGVVDFLDGVVTWNGDITSSNPITITFAVTPTASACQPVTNTALLTTGKGQELSMSATSVITGPLPAPEFTYVNSELVFTFTNQTSSPIPLDYLWDFGDGSTSTEVSPVHAYALPGQYVVTLTASSLCGTVSVSQPVQATCSAPQASFTWLGNDLSVSFTNQSSGHFTLSYVWDFGDGTTSTQVSPVHEYLQPSTYDVSLVASDQCGTGTYHEQVTTTCTPPTALFTWQNDGLTVMFTDFSAGTQPLSYAWDFGDGNKSTDPSPSHAYASPGKYTVRLSLTGPCGASEYERIIIAGNLVFLPLTSR